MRTFLAGMIMCLGWLALMMAGGEFAVFLPDLVELMLRVGLVVCFWGCMSISGRLMRKSKGGMGCLRTENLMSMFCKSKENRLWPGSTVLNGTRRFS
jgi:hypothetical protein